MTRTQKAILIVLAVLASPAIYLVVYLLDHASRRAE